MVFDSGAAVGSSWKIMRMMKAVMRKDQKPVKLSLDVGGLFDHEEGISR